MEQRVKTWGLISGLAAVLVISLVASRVLLSTSDVEQTEVLSVNGKQNRDQPSQDEVMTRLQQMENRLADKSSPVKQSTPTFESSDINKLQEQIDILTQQVAELTKLVARNEINNPGQRREELRKLQVAALDPQMQEKYQQFQEDLSHQRYELINQAFQQEEVDRQWAMESEDTLKTSFYKNETLVGSELVGVDCRTSICRMSVSMPRIDIENVDDATEQFVRENELLASIAKEMPGKSTVRIQPDGKGGVAYDIFVYREGYKQPEIRDPLAGKTISEKIDYIERY